MKKCSKCKLFKDLSLYCKNKNCKDGLQTQCNDCLKEHRTSPKGWALKAWSHINERCLNKIGSKPTYVNVECRLSKQEFINWVIPVYIQSKIKYPDAILSVDRINDGHYELGNLQIIPTIENCRKRSFNRNIHAPSGCAWCGYCKQYLNNIEFGKNRHRANGLQDRCFKCRKATWKQSN